MNKTFLTTIFALLVLSVSVSAWHCVDNDASTPQKHLVQGHYAYGAWGDDAQLGGTTSYWLSDDDVPQGCTGSQGKYVCNDYCDGTTLREFYCGDRKSTTEKYEDCHYVGIGKNKQKVCETKTKTASHWGETVIFWNDIEDSKECGENVPEFGVMAGGLALVSSVGIFMYRRKK